MPRVGYEPLRRAGGQVAGRPVRARPPRPGRGPASAARSSRQCASRNGTPGLVEQGQPRGAGHDQVDRLARRRAGRASTAAAYGVPRRAGRPRRPTARRVIGTRQALRTIRSASAKTNRPMPTKPLAVKNARLTRDRSVGVHDRVLVDERGRGQRQPDPPQPAAARPATPNQTNSANVTTCTTVEARSAAATPKRAGNERDADLAGRPRRPGRRRSGRSRRSTARPRRRAPRPARTANVPVTASQAPTGADRTGPAPASRAGSR